MANNPPVLRRKAVSPVIATVILVAVALTVAVSVAFWMGGIAGQYTKFEQVEINTAYSVMHTGEGWKIHVYCKNTGTETATITTVYVNEVPMNSTGYGASDFPPDGNGDRVVTSVNSTGTTISSGEETTVYVWIYNDGTVGYSEFSSGTTCTVILHSANAADYIKLVELV